MKNSKKFGLNQILIHIKEGLSPSMISKKYNIPKQTLSYSVNKLKMFGCIEKEGYGVWKYIKEVPIQHKGSISGKNGTYQKQIRGHAFIWKIEFFEDILWEKFIKKSNINYQLICNNRVFRIILHNRKIWLTKKGMIIYEPIDFLGRSSFQVKGTAVFEMDKLVKSLLKKLKIRFAPYKFTTSREHYSMIKNKLAKQYNDKKEKLFVYGKDGGIWLWIDHSHGVHELETKDPKISRQIQKWYNSHKKTNFDVTPEFVLKAILEQGKNVNKNAEHLEYHAENMGAHVGATKDLSQATKTLNKNLEKQTELFEKMIALLTSKL